MEEKSIYRWVPHIYKIDFIIWCICSNLNSGMKISKNLGGGGGVFPWTSLHLALPSCHPPPPPKKKKSILPSYGTVSHSIIYCSLRQPQKLIHEYFSLSFQIVNRICSWSCKCYFLWMGSGESHWPLRTGEEVVSSPRPPLERERVKERIKHVMCFCRFFHS